VYARYETHYGEEQSRLSRENSIIAQDEQEIQWTKPLISVLSLRTADQYLTRLESLFIDEFVYGHAWNAFMATCIKGWQRSGLNSAALLLYAPHHYVPPIEILIFIVLLACISYASSSLFLLF